MLYHELFSNAAIRKVLFQNLFFFQFIHHLSFDFVTVVYTSYTLLDLLLAGAFFPFTREA